MWPAAIQLALKVWTGLVSVFRGTTRLIKRIAGRRAFDQQQRSDEQLHDAVQKGDSQALNDRLKGFNDETNPR